MGSDPTFPSRGVEPSLLPIYGMFYMMFVHKFKPHPRGIVAVLIMLAALTVPALLLNQAFDTANYLYLKPSRYSMYHFAFMRCP